MRSAFDGRFLMLDPECFNKGLYLGVTAQARNLSLLTVAILDIPTSTCIARYIPRGNLGTKVYCITLHMTTPHYLCMCT